MSQDPSRSFSAFVETIARLRDPVAGCPWDLKQTFSSLRRYMIEEAYEAVTAMGVASDSRESCQELVDELGDVLLQVVLNAQIGKDLGIFEISDVVASIDAKMKRRHPHVFGELVGASLTADDVVDNWKKIKKDENSGESKGTGSASFAKDVFPASLRAYKIGQQAHAVDFDWEHTSEVLAQLRSEISELEDAMANGNRDALEDELGDIYFTLSQVARHLDLDPETAAHRGNAKFLSRFSSLEAEAKKRGTELKTLPRSQKEDLWKKVKSSGPMLP